MSWDEVAVHVVVQDQEAISMSSQSTAYTLQIMGQQEISTSDSTSIKVIQLPKLTSDGEN